jgi:hypothetical protein
LLRGEFPSSPLATYHSPFPISFAPFRLCFSALKFLNSSLILHPFFAPAFPLRPSVQQLLLFFVLFAPFCGQSPASVYLRVLLNFVVNSLFPAPRSLLTFFTFFTFYAKIAKITKLIIDKPFHFCYNSRIKSTESRPNSIFKPSATIQHINPKKSNPMKTIIHTKLIYSRCTSLRIHQLLPMPIARNQPPTIWHLSHSAIPPFCLFFLIHPSSLILHP